MQKRELELSRKLAQEMGSKIEVWNVEDAAPRRIQVLVLGAVQALDDDQQRAASVDRGNRGRPLVTLPS